MRIHEVYAYLRVKGAAHAIDFYQQAFGAKERFRLTEPSGRVGHAELDFAGTVIMLSDEFPESNIVGPATIGATSCSIHLHVDNADEVLQHAVSLGAILLRPATDHFYGERSGTLRDPFGHEWLIGHSIETVTPEEMQARYTKLLSNEDS